MDGAPLDAGFGVNQLVTALRRSAVSSADAIIARSTEQRARNPGRQGEGGQGTPLPSLRRAFSDVWGTALRDAVEVHFAQRRDTIQNSGAGLPGFRMHDCRHHVASVYLSQHRSTTYVQRLLGHSNPSTLLSIYSWVTKDESDIATTEFEKWLGEEERALYAA